MGSFRALLCALMVGQAMGMFLMPVPNFNTNTVSKTTMTSSAMKYFITGSKDNKGHWTEEVKVEHGNANWRIELDHSTLQAESGNPKFQITATLTAKDSKENEIKAKQEEEPKKQEVYTGVIFQLFPKSHRDWFEAQKECREWGGNLAVPNTKPKVDKMTEILNEHNLNVGEFSAAFLGFNDLEHEGKFMTIFGDPVFSLEESVWSPNWYNSMQPDDDKSWTKDGEDCGSLRPNGGLNDVPCRYSLPFICEKPRATEPTQEEGSAEQDYLLNFSPEFVSVLDYDSGDYEERDNEDDDDLRLFPRSVSDWYQAKEACQSWGGHLAIPDSEEKVLKMAKMLKSPTMNPGSWCAFVGFNDIEKEGDFVTIFGKSVFDSTAKWTPRWFNDNQPDDDKGWTVEGEDCGSIHPSGGLNDVPCRYHLAFFCEKTQESASTDTSTAQPEIETNTSSAKSRDDQLLELMAAEDELQWTSKLFNQTDLDWFGARDACIKWGGRLVVPNSSVKETHLRNILHSMNVALAYVDSEDTYTKKPLKTFDTINPYQTTGEDDFQPDNECSVIAERALYVVPCSLGLPFFCEKPNEGDKSAEDDQSSLKPSANLFDVDSPNLKRIILALEPNGEIESEEMLELSNDILYNKKDTEVLA